jgi:hypothetical protein
MTHLETILRKMFELVNANYDTFDFTQDNWYWEYTWTPEQEKIFHTWLYGYMRLNTQARNELMSININTKKNVTDFVNNFIFTYGWKTTEEE